MAREKQRVIVKIKSGQSYILPSGANIISLTELEGATADSLCAAFPPSTPLATYTFFIEKEVFRSHFINTNSSLNVVTTGFYIGDEQVADWTTKSEIPAPLGGVHTVYGGIGIEVKLDRPTGSTIGTALKALPQIIAVYLCSDLCSDNESNCNNTITITMPSSYEIPSFELMITEDSSAPWFSRLYPIDPDQPGQVQREPCTNRV